MKKILLLIASAAIALAVNAAPQKVDFGKLPKNSQEFIQKNFPGEKVKAVEMDREASWDKYTVYFNSGMHAGGNQGSSYQRQQPENSSQYGSKTGSYWEEKGSDREQSAENRMNGQNPDKRH